MSLLPNNDCKGWGFVLIFLAVCGNWWPALAQSSPYAMPPPGQPYQGYPATAPAGQPYQPYQGYPAMASPVQPYQGYPGMAPPYPVRPNQYLQAQPNPYEERIARVEHAVFGSTYPEHELDDRLEHLEREEFGKPTSGDMESRLAKLEGKVGIGTFSKTAPPTTAAAPAEVTAPAPAQFPGQSPPAAPTSAQVQRPPAWAAKPPASTPTPSASGPATPAPADAHTSSADRLHRPAATAGAPPPAPAFVARQPQEAMPLSPSAAQRAEQPVFMSDLRPQQPASSSAAVPVGEGPGSQTGDGGSAITGLSQWQKSPSASSDVPPKSMVAAVQPLAAADFAAERSRSEFETAVASIPADEKSGDYLTNIDRFAGHCYARWQTFPVRIHIPLSASAVAKNALDGAVHAWAMNIPIMVVSVKEPADIEIAWIDRLPPKQLGMTNLEVFNGHMRATIYLLRPDAKTSAGQLQSAAEHELGHALGLWGHSPVASDVMHLSESPSGKAATISPRDINTLKKVYQAPALPEGFEIPQPVGWSLIR